MFIHVSEDTHDEFRRQARTFCKDCDQYATVRLVERVRTVTAYWVLKSTERKHFLSCDSCRAQFKVKARNRASYTPKMMKIWRFTQWAAPAITVALLLSAWLKEPYQP